jgi:hypothetical protein
MPVIAAARIPGQGNIAQKVFYCERKRQGVHALFYGTGCKKGDDGWGLLVVCEATEQEFNALVLSFSPLIGIHPSELFTASKSGER